MSHASARTTFHGRLLMVRRHQAGWPKAHIAAAMGVSRTCVKTWIDRFVSQGEPGLDDRLVAAAPDPDANPGAGRGAHVELRRRDRRGPDWIGV